MLSNASEHVRECYEHAEYCARKAATQTDPRIKQDYLDLERHWLTLARSYEFSAAIAAPYYGGYGGYYGYDPGYYGYYAPAYYAPYPAYGGYWDGGWGGGWGRPVFWHRHRHWRHW